MDAYEILLSRAREQDPIAHALVTAVEHHDMPISEAVAKAIEIYSSEHDRLKQQMLRYLERHSQPITILKMDD
jgi:hypothetical protein